MSQRAKTYHGTISNLKRLENLQQQSCCLLIKDVACSDFGSTVDLLRAEDSRQRRCKVWQHASKTNVVCLLGYSREVEGVADRFLVHSVSSVLMHKSRILLDIYQVRSNSRAHIYVFVWLLRCNLTKKWMDRGL